MYDITLVCTQHNEAGKCNAGELNSIIAKVGPEIIFEELSDTHFYECYEQESLITLETTAVKAYLTNHKIQHIPIDTYPLPNNYYKDVKRLYDKLFHSNMIQESRDLCYLTDKYFASAVQHGFNFLNSDPNDKYFEDLNLQKERILDILNDEDLYRIFRLEKEIVEKREYQIVKKIHNFSVGTPFNKAIMMIGSAHRKSILRLIEEFETQGKASLRWRNFIY